MPRLEEPCGIPSAPALLQLSRFAAEHVKVVLAGQGADEPHGGYGRHQAAALLEPRQARPGRARHARPPRWPGRCRAPPAPAAPPTCSAAAATPSACCASWRSPTHRCARRCSAARRGEAEAERAGARRTTVLGDVAGRGLLEQALYLDTRMFLPDGILICNDKMSMAASLELRVPFLDVELMRFVERIPARARVRPRAGKRLHRMAMERLLPPRDRRAPQARLLHPLRRLAARSLGEEVERRYAPGRAAGRAGRAREAVAQLVDEHRRGRADHKSVLYCLLELSEWHRAFVEAREPVAGVTWRASSTSTAARRASSRSTARSWPSATRSRTSTSPAACPTRCGDPRRAAAPTSCSAGSPPGTRSSRSRSPGCCASRRCMIIGGFDTANMPDIGYGYQQGGLRRWASRWIMRRADRLITNSDYSLSEIERNTPIPPERGDRRPPRRAGPVRRAPRRTSERMALTVGAIDRGTLVQKGQLPFVQAAPRAARRALRVRGQVAGRRGRAAARGRAGERRAHRLALRRGPARRSTGARRSTCRPRATRASAWRWRRRCWPAACRS